jgi:hypothetical protein
MDQHAPSLPLDFVDLLAVFANAEVQARVGTRTGFRRHGASGYVPRRWWKGWTG